MDEEKRGSSLQVVAEGNWEGWNCPSGDPFNDTAGPFYVRPQQDGTVICAMQVQPKHLNGGGMMHGGVMMTFADFCLYAFAGSLGDAGAVTITLNGDYIGAVPEGAIVECTGEMLRRTGSMAFVRGVMRSNDAVVFTFSGVLKFFSKR